jgi:RNA polymerase sporulation-specific sigma factor
LALRDAIEKLPRLQQKLVVLRYFRDLSQSEVAKILGLTQVKVSREEKKIMATLRAFLT